MKLLSITFGKTPRLPGISASDTGKINCIKPNDALRDWKVVIRGSQFYLVSPAGWIRDQSTRKAPRNVAGPCTMFGPLSLSDAYFEWEVAEDDIDSVLKAQKWESPPFGWTPKVVESDKPIIDQIPPGQLGDA